MQLRHEGRIFMGLCVCFALPVVLAACATTGGTEAAGPVEETAVETAPRKGGSYPRLTIDGGNYSSLGALVRAIGEQRAGGGVVLVSGLEERPAPAVSLERAAYGRGLERLAGPAECLVYDAGYYQFIYPPGYEALLEVSVAEAIHPLFRDQTATFAVGAGTNMYNALGLLSEVLGKSIVADNDIAEVWCGELFVENAPVGSILEALLQSARVLPGKYVVESTAEYIFVRSTSNRSDANVCLNADGLPAGAAEMLARVVDVRVPLQDGELRFQDGYVPLESVLPALSVQAGVEVSAAAGMESFPVHPAAFLQMPVSDVMNLIVRQWPVGGFGYVAGASGIHFQRRSP